MMARTAMAIASFCCEGGDRNMNTHSTLPHHRLEAWHVALELVRLVHSLRVGDAADRDQARKAASACARNVAEGAARTSRGDKARVYGIARGEYGECVACVELAGAKGACRTEDVAAVVELGGRLSAMLYRLAR
jgi:four helix bundle protein